MKLSTVVQYLNHLQTVDVRDAARTARAAVAQITHTVQHDPVQVGEHAASLIALQQDLESTLAAYQQQLQHLRDDVQQLIQHMEPAYFAASTQNYQGGMRSDTAEYILRRHSPVDPDTEKILCDRLATYTDWHYPGMVLRPGHAVGLASLVALDPLYLVDTDQDLFATVSTLFTPEYQRRLRYYVIEEYTDHKIFWNLPQAQFGFVLAWRYFDFKPWEVLQQYLNEVFDLLRPGGTFVFSFNDCDHWRSVGLTEHHYCCYTPGRLIREHVNRLGFEITYDYNDGSSTSWLEIKKPGVLDSLRGAQALASINNKVNLTPKVIDNSAWDLYNELDLNDLIRLAQRLNVDISQDLTKHEFNIKKVRRTITEHLRRENYSEDTLRQLFTKEKP